MSFFSWYDWGRDYGRLGRLQSQLSCFIYPLLSFSLSTDVNVMIVSFGLVDIWLGDGGCDGRLWQLPDFYSPLEIRFFKELHSIISASKSDHDINSARS